MPILGKSVIWTRIDPIFTALYLMMCSNDVCEMLGHNGAQLFDRNNVI